MGVVMLLKTGNDQIRFKPRPIEGVTLPPDTDAEYLLLDGQQRLTSLTQALTGDGVVSTKDSRGKLMDRRYYIDISARAAGRGPHRRGCHLSAGRRRGAHATSARTLFSTSPPPRRSASDGYFPLRLLLRRR